VLNPRETHHRRCAQRLFSKNPGIIFFHSSGKIVILNVTGWETSTQPDHLQPVNEGVFLEKRILRFTSLDDVLQDLVLRKPSSAETTGVWSYSQILNHCSDELESVVRDVKPYPWIIRVLIGDHFRKKFLKDGFYTRPPFGGKKSFWSEGNERTALIRLRNMIAGFKSLPGPMVFHPFYGRIPKAECEKLLAFHAAHHFEFIREPKG